ncbi:GNAT family N-acetyltransferase [Aquamicrobium segne]|uniref:L-ornithine N(alpha)-acyltransferase n=1 Tax=Aquamicrobium segne TaxID=469547 RepID=A0ABW0GXA1_9HYPH
MGCKISALTGTLGRIGSLEVRLARNPAEIRAAQKIRYRIFYDELGARPGLQHINRYDSDRFDPLCDHLLVLDHELGGPDHQRIVATYRLLRQDMAQAAGGFYSEGEFELNRLTARHPQQRFLELGRSCVLPEYRSRRSIEALWQGIWAYLNHYNIDVMVGCASFSGTDPSAHAEALTYLAHHCRASHEWDVRAVAGRYQPMKLIPIEAVTAKTAIAAMPPLVKAYLRVGARVGNGCVIDHDFATVDIFIVMPVKEIAARYISYYGGTNQPCATA